MTKKDYVAIADIIKIVLPNLDYKSACNMISRFDNLFKDDNPNFDSEKFISYINQ